jgi:hypothetical protein
MGIDSFLARRPMSYSLTQWPVLEYSLRVQTITHLEHYPGSAIRRTAPGDSQYRRQPRPPTSARFGVLARTWDSRP